MKSRNSSLDVLRGIAVLMVICCHYSFGAFMMTGAYPSHFYYWLTQLRNGVDLFFVLSGFLISGLLFSDLKKYDRIRVGRFLFRRGFKIYPPLWAFLAATSIAIPAVRSQLPLNLVFLQNYFMSSALPWPTGAWGHLWSLAIEEHFYLALPFLLIVLANFRKLHWIPAISITFLLFCLVSRVSYGFHHSPFVRLMFPTHLRIDALFAGVALGYLFHFEREKLNRLSRWWSLPLGCFCLFLAFVGRGPDLNAVLFSLSLLFDAVGFALIVAWAVTRNLRFAPLQFAGQHSYSIYLWHVIMLHAIFSSKPLSILGLIEATLACTLFGALAAKLVEVPALKLRERLDGGSYAHGNEHHPAARKNATVAPVSL